MLKLLHIEPKVDISCRNACQEVRSRQLRKIFLSCQSSGVEENEEDLTSRCFLLQSPFSSQLFISFVASIKPANNFERNEMNSMSCLPINSPFLTALRSNICTRNFQFEDFVIYQNKLLFSFLRNGVIRWYFCGLLRLEYAKNARGENVLEYYFVKIEQCFTRRIWQ